MRSQRKETAMFSTKRRKAKPVEWFYPIIECALPLWQTGDFQNISKVAQWQHRGQHVWPSDNQLMEAYILLWKTINGFQRVKKVPLSILIITANSPLFFILWYMGSCCQKLPQSNLQIYCCKRPSITWHEIINFMKFFSSKLSFSVFQSWCIWTVHSWSFLKVFRV